MVLFISKQTLLPFHIAFIVHTDSENSMIFYTLPLLYAFFFCFEVPRQFIATY